MREIIAVVPHSWLRPLYLVALLFPFLAVSAIAAGQQASGPPARSDREALIARTRPATLSYRNQLEDFICTEMVTRTGDRSGSGKHWKILETHELELRFVDHRENYVLLKVNGESQDMDKRIKAGFFKGGSEFGTAWWIFDPKANAEFSWDREETNGGRWLCIFRYQVGLATSTNVMQVDSDKLTVAHHGFVYADCQNGSVMRIHIETEPAAVNRTWGSKSYQLPVGNELDVRYGVATIGTKEFLVPQSAEEVNRFGQTLTKAEIQFQNYRKFQADSKIISLPEERRPEPAPGSQG